MLDIKFIRENPSLVKKACKNRGYDIDIDNFLRLDEKYRTNLQKVEKLKYQRNTAAKEINELKKQGKDIKAKIKEVKEIPTKIKKLEEDIKELKEKIFPVITTIPNIPDPSVPIGADETKNKEVKKKGKIPKFNFEIKPHWEIGKNLDIIDVDKSIKLAGAGFYIFKGLGARLERALINFFLDYHIKNGFIEICPPVLVNDKSMFGTAQLPKFEQDLYKTTEGLYLIPTSEVPLTNLHQDEILNKEELPKYYCAFTPCFRTEAGKHGTETRGIYRLHQFDKVEMVKICYPDHSDKELEDMRQTAEKLLELLEIPYRTLLLCTGDVGFAASKTYDIEVWSPYQKKYLETSSCSNCKDFQARRINTKFRTPEGNKFVHTLNGSGLATPRLIISLLECNQQKDGSIKIPKVLQPYMDGIKKIEAKKSI
ncbi:serine--tRNA ligase [Candidatus Woesearchaeota archaeon]|nr:serine--tRNA ligase [Candidatus Woesearchaeota archaeon]